MISLSSHAADVVNGGFEAVGALACWWNVRTYARERDVKGVYWPSTLFFSVWGIWNCFYYPSLRQPFSAVMGALLAAGNTTWVIWVVCDKWRSRR